MRKFAMTPAPWLAAALLLVWCWCGVSPAFAGQEANWMSGVANQIKRQALEQPAELVHGAGEKQAGPRHPATRGLVPFPPGVPMPLPVGVGLLVNEISKINEVANAFDGAVDLRLRWKDPRLAFNAKAMGTDRQEFGNEAAIAKLASIWNPQVTIANMNEKDAQIAPGLFIYADGSVDYIQRIKATLDTKLNLSAFPFDTQSLPLVMLSSKYTINQLALVQSQADIDASGLKDGLAVRGWKPHRLEYAASRLRAWNGDFVPQFVASVTVQRVPNAHLSAILTPFLLTLLIPTTFTLFVKADIAPRLTAWAGSILALVALSFTFSVRYASLDNDSLVAQLVSTGFAFQFMMVVLSVTIFHPQVADRLANRFIVAESVNCLRWGIPLGFLGVILTEALLTAFSW